VSDRGLSRSAAALACLALALSIAAIYAPVTRYEFIVCDDDDHVYENPIVRQGVNAHTARWALTHSYAANWQPLTWLSHMVVVDLFGLDAGKHHAVNAALHALAAVLLLLALCALSGEFWASAAVAALFALHPLRVESVAWVSERKDVLSGVFFAAALWAYAAHARRPRWWRLAWVAVLLALGLAAKPMLVSLPVVLLLLDDWPLRRLHRETALRLFAEKLPLFALSAAVSALAIASQAGDGAMPDLASLPFATRLSNALVSAIAYLGKFAWPTRLAIFYPHPALTDPVGYSPWNADAFGAAALLVLLTLAALLTRRRHPAMLVGWLWYLVMLAPVIGLVQVGEQAMADRYTYLPMIGIAIALAFGLRDAVIARPALLRPVAIAAAVVLLSCAVRSAQQLRVWENGRLVFEHALAVTERNYFAHNHLGRALENRGELEAASEQYTAAIQIRPSPGALSNLGNTLAKQGRYSEAVTRFEQALAIDSDFADAHSNLGLVYAMMNEPDPAKEHYLRAIALAPDSVPPRFNLGSLLVRYGDPESGRRQLERVLELDPQHAEAANNLGVALVAVGRPLDAIAAYERVIALAPQHPNVYCNLGIAFEQAGQPTDALQSYERSLEGDAACLPGLRFVGQQRYREGALDAAMVLFEKLLRLLPQNADAESDVGAVLARRGEFDAAQRHFEAALRLDPRHTAAARNLEQLRVDRASVTSTATSAPMPGANAGSGR
jgi:protein O-mannosyl-transferase